MKKIAAFLLSALFLCCLFPAMAQEQAETPEVSITYEGVWYPLPEIGMQIYLPYEWLVYAQEDAFFMCGDAEGVLNMWVELIANEENYTYETIWSELEAAQGYENVEEIDFSDTKLVYYEDPDTGIAGAVTLSADASNLCVFYFSTNSVETQQIITTISKLQEIAPAEDANW